MSFMIKKKHYSLVIEVNNHLIDDSSHPDAAVILLFLYSPQNMTV